MKFLQLKLYMRAINKCIEMYVRFSSMRMPSRTRW